MPTKSMTLIYIPHRLGEWAVMVLTGCSDIPEGCKDWLPNSSGYSHQGHVVGYLKRLANHSPDSSSKWVVYEFRNRWFLAYRLPPM